MKLSCKGVSLAIMSLFILLALACSEVSESADSTPANAHVSSVSAQECQTTSKEELLQSMPLESSLTYHEVSSWHGPDALIKTQWQKLSATGDFAGPIEITGARVGEPETAEFLHYDGEWIRRTNLIIQPDIEVEVGYVIFPAPGCWEFQVRAGGDLLGTFTTLSTYERPEAQRLLPPAASEHGAPPPEVPQSPLQATCPSRDNGIQVRRRGRMDSLHIDLSSSGTSQIAPVSMEWQGPDKRFPVTWVTVAEPPLEIEVRNSTSVNPAWLEVWDPERPNFYHLQPVQKLSGELQHVDGDDKFWRGRILFPEPGCWLITARGADVERELSLWVEPVSRRTG